MWTVPSVRCDRRRIDDFRSAAATRSATRAGYLLSTANVGVELLTGEPQGFRFSVTRDTDAVQYAPICPRLVTRW